MTHTNERNYTCYAIYRGGNLDAPVQYAMFSILEETFGYIGYTTAPVSWPILTLNEMSNMKLVPGKNARRRDFY